MNLLIPKAPGRLNSQQCQICHVNIKALIRKQQDASDWKGQIILRSLNSRMPPCLSNSSRSITFSPSYEDASVFYGDPVTITQQVIIFQGNLVIFYSSHYLLTYYQMQIPACLMGPIQSQSQEEKCYNVSGISRHP